MEGDYYLGLPPSLLLYYFHSPPPPFHLFLSSFRNYGEFEVNFSLFLFSHFFLQPFTSGRHEDEPRA
jgi:hypothetical protein